MGGAWFCPNCGTQNSGGFCQSCGAPRAQTQATRTVRCDKCGWMPNPGEGWYVSAAGNYMLEVTMGHGAVNFETVFELLLRSGYDGWYSLEYFGAGDVPEQEQSIKNVRRYYGNACARAAVSGTAGLLAAK